MKKALIVLSFLLPATFTWLSCGGYTPGSSSTQTSGLKFRAFVSNNVSAGTSAPGIYILNAQTDVLARIPPISAGNTPGMMVVSPNHAQTLAFSGSGTQDSDNLLTFINNASETDAAHLTLPGGTESIIISPDGSTGYVAVPTAPVVGLPPGVVDVVSMNSGNLLGEVNVPAVRYISINNGGNRVFGFSDNSDQVAVITPSNLGIGTTVTYIGGTGTFDRPVAAFFSSDDTTAYVLSCGAECGGVQAGVQQFDLTTNQLIKSVPACATSGTPPVCVGPTAGSIALVNGSTMYVAGTPYSTGGGPSLTCPAGTTAAEFCGQLTIIDLVTMSVTNSAPIFITDGYHNHIAMGANGQLFIGARTCTEILPTVPPQSGAEVRGCLSIYNTLSGPVGSVQAGGVLIPPVSGEVTGLQPIATRQVVYLIQNGTLNIYDTTTDALFDNPNDANNPGEIFGLVGQLIDVVTPDF